MHTPVKYFMYVRRSTDDNTHQVRSIQDQKAELRELARRRNLDIVEMFEESCTAKVPGRPVFNFMMDRIEAGEAQGIVAWHPDRLARNDIDSGRIKYAIMTGAIADLQFSTFQFMNDAAGRLALSQQFAWSTYYSDNLSENIQRGQRRKVADGIWPGCRVVGYLNDTKSKRLVIDPKSAPHVKRAFELFATGNYTFQQIAEFLNENGVRGVQKARRILYAGTVHRMLSNPFYYGRLRFKGELHEGAHEPLVSKLLFDKCQKMMSRRSRPKSKRLLPYLYRGLIRCSVCGGLVTTERSKGHVYLHCTKRREPCRSEYSPAVREEAITEQVTAFIARHSVQDDWADAMLAKLRDEQAVMLEAATAERDRLKEKRQAFLDKLDRAQEGWLDGAISLAAFREISTKLKDAEYTIREQIAQLDQQDGDRLEPMARFIKASKQAKKVATEGTAIEKRDFFRKVGSNPNWLPANLSVSHAVRGKLLKNSHF